MKHGLNAGNGYLWDGIDKLFNSEQEFIDVVTLVLDGSDYENGELETIRSTGINTARVVSRLMWVLLQSEKLTKMQVVYILDPSAKEK